jgi:hypothetical protein
MSMGLDRDLAFADRLALRLHLAVCSACSVMKSQFEFIRRALSTYAKGGRDDD